ncbi:substrate-binding domain-containing protein [Desemzia sp. FAM 23991]|uniref:substrate-binding domain-containing protein n=1 Tax=unclassified Desemzia TaxID=2685243 RepID=UPI0038863DF0
MDFKKISKYMLTTGAALLLAACGGGEEAGTESGDNAGGGDFDTSQTINVITREDGSGTRGAFTEITGVLVADGDTETDNTYAGATIQNSTNGVMTTVAGDPVSIGYISLGSINDTVKALMINGVEPSTETVQDGSYEIARPFNIAYSGELSEVAQDFWTFVMSAEGQELVVGEGYVEAVSDAPAYEAAEGLSGNVSVVGSTSVTPVMEVLVEEYKNLNPDVTIDITSNGSSAGMTAAMDGSADIGMASRELKEEELAELTAEALAIDGIAVIVHPDNSVEDLTTEQVRQIYTGEVTTWADVAE